MGGAISLFSRPEAPFHAELGIESGAESTNETHGSVASTWGNICKMGASLELRALGTDGYFIVPGYLRGAADRRANVRFVSGAARLDWLGAHDQFFVKLDMLAEERQNGTALTNNSTSLGTLSAHYSHELSQGVVSVLAWRTQEDFRSTYSVVSANRGAEVLTDRQKVPSEATGAAAYAQRSAAHWHFTGGADVNRVEGYSHDASPTRTPHLEVVAGGTQLQDGAFGQFDISRGPAQFFAGARYDDTGVADRFFAPSAGVAAGKGMLRARGSVYRGFRAPKLNELYRPFRVGNVQTLANPLLRPETLFGAEAGFDLSGRTRRLSLTLFRNSLNHLITNATLSKGPNLIVRQKENAGPALSRGVEANLQQRWRNWLGQLGYLYADSRFQTGLAIPEVPRHQGSAQLSYERPRTGAPSVCARPRCNSTTTSTSSCFQAMRWFNSARAARFAATSRRQWRSKTC
jgi:outer membrane receptor protein involved in Fe transport